MATANYEVRPEDGWVKIADDPDFIRVTGFPYDHAYYLTTTASGDPAGAVSATGTITLSGLPVADDTVTINGQEYIFVAAAVEPNEVEIGADATATGENLEIAINALQVGTVSADNAAGIVTLTATPGEAGNDITLAEDATNVAVSGSTLTGGADPVLGIMITCKPFWCNVPIAGEVYVRTPNPITNSALRIDVFTA